MSKNIKDIGKELMGKSLNSFHRKTGLTQLEKNNKMQDGILNGILSQVDDAYIEKTEQSNVIHLDGSGDGVVVVDSIEGNTLVNIMPDADWGYFTTGEHGGNCAYMVELSTLPFKPNTVYTTILLNAEGIIHRHWMHSLSTSSTIDGTIGTFTTVSDISTATSYLHIYFSNGVTQEQINKIKVLLLEGDWTNREIPPYFEGLQSSFEECKVTQQMVDSGEELEENLGKYKCLAKVVGKNKYDFKGKETKTLNSSGLEISVYSNKNYLSVNGNVSADIYCYATSVDLPYCEYPFKKGKIYKASVSIEGNYSNSSYNEIMFVSASGDNIACRVDGSGELHTIGLGLFDGNYNQMWIRFKKGAVFENCKIYFQIEEVELTSSSSTTYEPYVERTQTVYLNSPLLKGDEIVCKEDGLYHWHKMNKDTINGSRLNPISFFKQGNYNKISSKVIDNKGVYKGLDTLPNMFCDKFKVVTRNQWSNDDSDSISLSDEGNVFTFSLNPTVYGNDSTETINYFNNNPITVIYELAEPYFEKITNEYGEPIILEGYENGTLYIDSTIVPTTTVRYTPKMESFKTYKEVKIRNAINDFDVTENVIPYMMEVDMKLTELEMSAISTYNIKNIRKMEVLDMTSMQERTFKMLERLIRGKSHTKQELIDRVLLYEQAKRITTEQALELNLIIEEVYGA